jgi:hypothetical protein
MFNEKTNVRGGAIRLFVTDALTPKQPRRAEFKYLLRLPFCF